MFGNICPNQEGCVPVSGQHRPTGQHGCTGQPWALCACSGLQPWRGGLVSETPEHFKLTYRGLNWKSFQAARVTFSPPPPSALTFMCFLSPGWKCDDTLFISAFLLWMWKFGVKKRFHLSFSKVSLPNSYFLFLCLNKQFPLRNVQKTF